MVGRYAMNMPAGCSNGPYERQSYQTNGCISTAFATFASWLVQNGASLYQVQNLLGHTNPRVTQVYAHLQPTEMHDIVEMLPLRN